MKQTIEEAAIKELNSSYAIVIEGELAYQRQAMFNMFKKGAEWQMQQSPWISVKERLPDYNENIIIMCKHGAIFNGTYFNGVWFCMDGYIHDTFKGTPVYSSMASIPPLWEPIAWMTIPKFNDSGRSVFPNDQVLTGKICGNCEAYCECQMAGAEHNDVACPGFDDSVLNQLNNNRL